MKNVQNMIIKKIFGIGKEKEYEKETISIVDMWFDDYFIIWM